jgi:DNA-directed RNA polymerase subunit RPC12/RpoP
MAEVFESLLRLGLKACPVCGSEESLGMSPFPAILVDGEFPLDSDALPEEEGDLTFAVRIECTTCGHLMLFNAQRYRTGDEKILEREIAEDIEPRGE